MFKIKNFGNDVECLTVQEVVTALEAYRGKSISILQESEAGLKRTHFIDISSDGVFKQSYGAQDIVDIPTLLAADANSYQQGRAGVATAKPASNAEKSNSSSNRMKV